MAISDLALDYIESQKPGLLDFIFRLTGDRSRAGIIANEVCVSVHRDLLSRWTQQDIRIELFTYAYEINADASRGIEKAFFEQYYRNQFNDVRKIASLYPLELFLYNLGPKLAMVATLEHRYHFSEEEIARILRKPLEEVVSDKRDIHKALKSHPKIKLEDAAHLPIYDFLQTPDQHPTAISHILGDLKPKIMAWEPKLIGLLMLLGFIVGYIIYQASKLLEP